MPFPDITALAQTIGLHEDLGKNSEAFKQILQRRRRGPSAESHAMAGALLDFQVLYENLGPVKALGTPSAALLAALVESAHHGGLVDREEFRLRIEEQLERKRSGSPTALDLALKHPISDEFLQPCSSKLPDCIFNIPEWLKPRSKERVLLSFEALTRIVASAVADSDYEDAERHSQPDRHVLRLDASIHAPTKIRSALDLFVKRDRSDKWRAWADVMSSCRSIAMKEPGLFSLTMRQDARRALAAQIFAFRHAERNNLQRVFHIVPGDGLIEDRARLFRNVLEGVPGQDASGWLVEQHAHLNPGDLTEASRLATENYDAPWLLLSLRTFFECFHARKPSAIRGLHRMTRSVLIFEDAHRLETGFLQPFLEAVAELVKNYGSTAIFVSSLPVPFFQDVKRWATHGIDGLCLLSGKAPSAIVTAPTWPLETKGEVRIVSRARDGQAPIELDWDDVGALIRRSRQDQALVIVNSRADARTLYRRLRGQVPFLRHLSPLMCARHQSEIMRDVQERLKKKWPCVMISTPIVETSLDLSFPLVLRAISGFDSLRASSELCNRDGRARGGCVTLFKPREGSILDAKTNTGSEIIGEWLRKQKLPDLSDPAVAEKYFREFYRTRSADTREIRVLRSQLQFRTVAARSRLLERGYTEPAIMPHHALAQAMGRFQDNSLFHYERLRALQAFIVMVPEAVLGHLLSKGMAHRESNYSVPFVSPEFYDWELGLLVEDELLLD